MSAASRLDDLWKIGTVVGLALLVCKWYDPQHLVVTRHGVGFLPWDQLALVGMALAALTSVLTHSSFLKPLLTGLALVPVTALVLFACLVAFVFMFGGQARADQIALRLLDACDRLLALVPHTSR